MMQLKHYILFIVLLLLIPNFGKGQEAEIGEKEVILKRESSAFMDLRTNGWGVGYRYGKFKTGYKLKSWDFSFSVVKDLQQIKTSFGYSDISGRIYYGKLIHFYNFKVLRGSQKVITTKPYWGGVELRRLFYGGINLGIGVPIWVLVYNFDDNYSQSLVRFDPDLHDRQDIQSKGPFSKGFSDIEFYPSISMKYALNAEYGTISQVAKGIEVGLQLDLYPIPVQIMAYQTPSYYIASAYISFHFGKRFNP